MKTGFTMVRVWILMIFIACNTYMYVSDFISAAYRNDI